MEELSTEAKDFFAKCANDFTEGELVLRFIGESGRKYFWMKDGRIEKSPLKKTLANSYGEKKGNYFDSVVYDCLLNSGQTKNSFVYAFYKGESNGVFIVGDMKEFLVEVVPESISKELKCFCQRNKAFAEVTNQLSGVFKRNKNISQIRPLYPFEVEPIRADGTKDKPIQLDKVESFIEETRLETLNTKSKTSESMVVHREKGRDLFVHYHWHENAKYTYDLVSKLMKNKASVIKYWLSFPNMQSDVDEGWVVLEEKNIGVFLEWRCGNKLFCKKAPVFLEDQLRKFAKQRGRLFLAPTFLLNENNNKTIGFYKINTTNNVDK